MEQIRQQFDKWWEQKLSGAFHSCPKEHRDSAYHAAWLAYQAAWRSSRAALVVDVSADDIKRIFLANGFKEKIQPHGGADLNPYVYYAALDLLEYVAGITVKGEGDGN